MVHALPGQLQRVEWSADGITRALKEAGESVGVGMRDVYRACYAVFMGAERGPRLAPILATCSREDMLTLVESCAGMT